MIDEIQNIMSEICHQKSVDEEGYRAKCKELYKYVLCFELKQPKFRNIISQNASLALLINSDKKNIDSLKVEERSRNTSQSTQGSSQSISPNPRGPIH